MSKTSTGAFPKYSMFDISIPRWNELAASTQTKIVAQAGLKNLCFFNKHILKYPDITENVHGEWEEFLKSGKKKKKLLLVPRGHLKTTFVTVGGSLQDIIRDNNNRILFANAIGDNAQSFLFEIKEHIKNNKTLHTYYPETASWEKNSVKWSEKHIIIPRTRQSKEPTIETSGVGGSLVSQHYDKIILDDLVNVENSATRIQADKVIDYYKQCISLLEPNGELIVIGTRYTYYELYQYIIDELKEDFDIFVRTCYKRLPGEKRKDGSRRPGKEVPYFPKKFTMDSLAEIKRSQGSYVFSCLPKEAPILMADWTEKAISKIKIGDKVVGWTIGSRHNKSKLKISKVLAIGKRKAEIVKVKLKSGREIKCTVDHKWYKNPTGNRKFSLYGIAKIGRPLMYFGRQQETRRDDWLGGIYDGEGSGDKTCIRIAQSKEHNPDVCNEIERRLNLYGFKWKYNKFGMYWINGGITERARFLQIANPIRKRKVLKTLFIKDFIQEKDKVISIKPCGEKVVYSIQTETGNYIAYGILSKNCQYKNEPVDDESAIFKKSWLLNYDRAPEPLYKVTTVDPAISKEKHGNYSAIVTTGVSEFGKKYILQIKRGKWNPFELIDQIFDTYSDFKSNVVGIESVSYQKSLRFYLEDEMKRRDIYMPLDEINPDTRITKEMKIKGLQPFYERGEIAQKKEMVELEEELIKFPVCATDDIIDALSNQIKFWQLPDIMAKKELEPVTHDEIIQKEFREREQKPDKTNSDETLGDDY